MSARVRGLLLLAAKIAVAGGIIAWLIRSDKLTTDEFRPVLAHGWHLAACVGLLAMLPLLGALRWSMLLGAQGFNVSYWRALHLTLVGILFNSIGVGYVGGDVVKAYYAAFDQPRGRRAEAVTSVVFDRLVGLVSLLLFAVLMMLLRPGAVWLHPPAPGLRLAGLALGAIFAAVVAVFLLAFSPRLRNSPAWAGWLSRLPGGETLLRTYRAVATYRTRPRTVALAVGISILGHGINMAVLWHLAQSLDFPPLAVADFAFCMAIGVAVSSFGLPLGIGLGQVTFGYLLSLYVGQSGLALGATLATLQQVVLLSYNLTVGLPAFLLVRKDVARVRAEMAADAAEPPPVGGPGG